MPVELTENNDVKQTIRSAMNEIGYEYYNNESCGKGCWLYRYAPKSAPVTYGPINEEEVKRLLHEELTKGEVRAMISSELEDFVKNEKLKKAIKNVTADVLEDFLDSLWRRKSFWKGTIKRN